LQDAPPRPVQSVEIVSAPDNPTDRQLAYATWVLAVVTALIGLLQWRSPTRQRREELEREALSSANKVMGLAERAAQLERRIPAALGALMPSDAAMIQAEALREQLAGVRSALANAHTSAGVLIGSVKGSSTNAVLVAGITEMDGLMERLGNLREELATQLGGYEESRIRRINSQAVKPRPPS
jgi:hypothetical protein